MRTSFSALFFSFSVSLPILTFKKPSKFYEDVDDNRTYFFKGVFLTVGDALDLINCAKGTFA